jgi:asparaginyl-tRNA synthetase
MSSTLPAERTTVTAATPITSRRPTSIAAPWADDAITRRMALVRIWDAMFRGAREYVESQGFIGVHNMPEIVGVTGACENVDTLFKVDYFGKQAYLAQSDQLYLELIVPHLKKVYAEIQSFRMEEAADDRHLCQFALFEIEHLGTLDELIGNIAGTVANIARTVARDCVDELAVFGVTPDRFDALSFGQMSYTQAVEELQQDFPDLEWGDDLKAHHERVLTERFGAMFLTHYPLPIKFFNMMQNEDDPRVVNSTDLLLPKAGESAGAAEREHEHTRIEERLKSSDMYKRLIELGGTDEDFAWYLDAHVGKEIPLHSGAGIGMARVAQWLLDLDDIRDAVPFLINSENLL